MNIDIVSRLRHADDFTSKTKDEWILEAADEIERLRKTMQIMVIDYRTQIAGLKMRCTCKENTNGI
jgi:hypothetical protein